MTISHEKAQNAQRKIRQDNKIFLPRRAQRTQSFVVFATKAVRHEEKLDGITELRGICCHREDGGRRTEGGEQKAENGEQKAEDGEQKAEDGEQKAEDGEQKAEDGGQQGGA